MKRRHFIAGSLAASGTVLLPNALLAANNPSLPATDKTPWQKGFAGVTEPFNTNSLKIEGKWPRDAYGSFYRNGPARMERNGTRLQHWFDGDGMVHRFNINAKGISHRSQFVATEKYLREENAQRYLYNTTGTLIPNASNARNNDSVNVANTALLPWQNELLALWEGGSAYSLNPDTLTTQGEKTWSEELAHVPFSAHPLLERDGSLWNFGFVPYSQEARLLIYHISPSSKVIGFSNIVLPQRGYLHAFAQTKDYLIFYISACVYQQGETFIKSFHWQPELGSKFLVLAKNSLDTPRWFDVPAGFVFHFGNAWQDKSNLHVSMALYKDSTLMLEGMHKLAVGIEPELEYPEMTYAKINLQTGKVSFSSTEINLEFPSFDKVATSATTLYGIHASSPTRNFWSDSLAAINPDKGLVNRYCFGAKVIAEEPLLIKSSSNNHYLITSYYNYDKQHSGIALFHAHKLNEGPVAQATMDYVLPLGFHGCFIPTKA